MWFCGMQLERRDRLVAKHRLRAKGGGGAVAHRVVVDVAVELANEGDACRVVLADKDVVALAVGQLGDGWERLRLVGEAHFPLPRIDGNTGNWIVAGMSNGLI